MADEDIKQQAEMQRQKAAPQPRDRENDPVESPEVDILENILKEISDVEINTDMTDLTLRVGFREMIEAQTQGFTQLSEKLVGNKLKDQEDKKEQRGIFGKILEKLDEQTKAMKAGEVPKLEGGFIGATLAILAGITGAFVGSLIGVARGIGTALKKDIPDFIVKVFTAITKVFTRIGQFGEFLLRKIGLGKQIDIVKTKFTAVTSGIRNFIGNIVTRVNSFIQSITDGFKGQRDLFKKGFVTRFKEGIKFFKDIGKTIYGLTLEPLVKIIASNFIRMRSIGRDLTAPFRAIAKVLAGGTKQAKKVEDAVGKIGKVVFRPISQFFKFFKGVFTTFGRAFARLFFPLTVIFGIFDTFKGVMKGAEDAKEGESRMVSMFIGGLKGLFTGLFAIPLDLLRKGVMWLSNKILGDDNIISKALGAFTFKDTFALIFDSIESVINRIIDGAVAFFKGIIAAPEAIADFFSGIPEAAGNMLDSVTEWFNGLIKGLLRSILPIQSESDGLVAGFIKGAAQSFIPDGVYEYAGIDKDTGQLLTPENVSALEIPRNGDQLEQEMNITRGQRKQQAVTANSVVDASVNRSTSQVINIVQGNTSNTARQLSDSFR